tara:strand:- start:406 stop:705 length:300 start_codon:yes stop_codon:yes gene_type:complete
MQFLALLLVHALSVLPAKMSVWLCFWAAVFNDIKAGSKVNKSRVRIFNKNKVRIKVSKVLPIIFVQFISMLTLAKYLFTQIRSCFSVICLAPKKPLNNG